MAGAGVGGPGDAGGGAAASAGGAAGRAGMRPPALAANPVAAALAAQPLGMEDLYAVARASCGSAEPRAWLMERLVEAERTGLAARYPDGRWGPAG